MSLDIEHSANCNCEGRRATLLRNHLFDTVWYWNITMSSCSKIKNLRTLHFSNNIFLKENDTNTLKYKSISASKIPGLASHIYCFYYFSVFLILGVLCCGKISFILNGFILPLVLLLSIAENRLTVALILQSFS